MSEGLSLREYIDYRFEESNRLLQLYNQSISGRLNEMDDVRDELQKSLLSLELTRANVEGNASQVSVYFAAAASIAGLILSAISLIIK